MPDTLSLKKSIIIHATSSSFHYLIGKLVVRFIIYLIKASGHLIQYFSPLISLTMKFDWSLSQNIFTKD